MFPETAVVTHVFCYMAKSLKRNIIIITQNLYFISKSKNLSRKTSLKQKELYLHCFSSVSCCLFFFVFTDFILTQLKKILQFKNVRFLHPFCLFMFVASRSEQQFFIISLGIHCIYLKSSDHESTNHV